MTDSLHHVRQYLIFICVIRPRINRLSRHSKSIWSIKLLHRHLVFFFNHSMHSAGHLASLQPQQLIACWPIWQLAPTVIWNNWGVTTFNSTLACAYYIKFFLLLLSWPAAGSTIIWFLYFLRLSRGIKLNLLNKASKTKIFIFNWMVL